MMIANRKLDPNPAVSKKSMRFNLGGLIKKKITWKKSIDALASSFHEVQLDYDRKEDAGTREKHESSPMDISLPSLDTAYTVTPQQQTLRHQSSSLDLSGYLNVPPSDRYSAFRTECISLQNSEMTSAMSDEESSHEAYQIPDLDFFSLSKSNDETEPYDASLEEPISDYRSGGYHPVKVGEQYSSDSNHYKVIRKLGWGHFSTVWLCVSVMSGDMVAMKIVKSGANYSDAARDEISILKMLQYQDEDDIGVGFSQECNANIVNLLDDFQITGPNGTHLAMVFELMGENLLHMVYNIRASRIAASDSINKPTQSLLPMSTVKCVVKQILQSVHYMHQRGVIHTDIKPENVLLALDEDEAKKDLPANIASRKFQILPSRPLDINFGSMGKKGLKVKIADLGNATHTHLHFTNNIQTRQYRAPEVLLKYKSWGASADVWSIGCLAFELLTGDYLFDPKDGATFSKDEDHLAQIIELTEKYPTSKYLSNCELSAVYFKDAQTMRNITSLKFWPLKSVLTEKYKFSADDADVNLLCDFLSKCLRYDLSERFDCASLLAHPWLNDSPVFDQWECDTLPNHNNEIIGFTREE